MKRHTFSRRQFLAASGAAAVPFIVPSSVFGKNAPSNRITIGCIGMGNQGIFANMNSFLNQDDAHVVAICDVQQAAIKKALDLFKKRGGSADCKCVRDFREVIADKSIDAVCISTPDHWHVPMSLMVLEAGKDVFCEKPTLMIAEGDALVEAVNKHKAVFQIGLEDRSTAHFHKLIEWVRNGAIGELKSISVVLPRGIEYPKEQPIKVPEGLDYNMWLGPAPFSPYTENRIHPGYWRNIRDYSGGMITDWGSHLMDTAQLAVNAPGVCPVEISGTGFIPKDSMTDVPVDFDIAYRYDNGIEVNVKSSKKFDYGRDAEIHLEGTEGKVSKVGWDGNLLTDPPEILRTRYKPEDSKYIKLPPCEQRNFLDCVKSRKATTYTAETMRDLCNTLHMGVIAIELGRKLKWDNKTHSFINDDQANKRRSRPARNWLC